MSDRREVLKNMVAQNPNDSFSRYGLAMEYANSGELELAMEAYQALLAVNPNYSAAYYHGGQGSLPSRDRGNYAHRRSAHAQRNSGGAGAIRIISTG